MKKKLIPKHQKTGKILINEPISESTYREQPPLSLYEQQFTMMMNNMGRAPTPLEQITQDKARQSALYSDAINTGVITEAKKDNIKNNFFRNYNNFRYSHPWAEGLNWTPVVGDVMDGISLLGDVNNGNYLSAGLGLGMLALPNFIQKPLQKYSKLQNVPDEVWDDLYNKAIKNNNLEEVQQLRDLHFKAKAPNTKITTTDNIPVHAYHGTGKHFTEFDTTGKHSSLDEGYWGKGAYFSPNKEIADIYANGEKTPIIYDTYLNIENPKHIIMENGDYYGKQIQDHDGVIATLPEDIIDPDFDMTEYVATKPHQIKSADAITYDDAGNIIPLSKRDNFSNPDIRYSWLIPTIPFGLMSYKLANEQKEYKQGGIIKFNPFNKFRI